MIKFKKVQYQTCKKCKYQSDVPQNGDCLIGIWRECPKCGEIEWYLDNMDFLQKVKSFLLTK